jgi:anthranilate synthase component 1
MDANARESSNATAPRQRARRPAFPPSLEAPVVQLPRWSTEERELLADLETPVSAFLKLRPVGARCLLETVERGAVLGRFSFIGLHPLLELVANGAATVLRTEDGGSFPVDGADPTRVLQATLELLRPAVAQQPGDLLGGAIGYLSYEYVRALERVPTHAPPAHAPALARFLVPRSLVTFDHLRRRLHLRTMQPVAGYAAAGSTSDSPTRAAVEAALAHAAQLVSDSPADVLDEMIASLSEPLPSAARPPPPAHPFAPLAEPAPAQFEERVRRAKEYIAAGDAFQVVLSQRLRGRLGVEPFSVYRALRMLNPSPYLFFVDFSPTLLVGSSPEVLVKLQGHTATVRPIAGTRPRGEDASGDRVLEEELLADEKERAEHVMLVDLGRNDLGRVCEYGSVQVTDFSKIERYSHVMHLVSYVRGTLRDDRGCFDLLRATFPAGTVSGAPKVRALEIVHELEDFARGPYSGALGYFGPDGDMDLCITIRTIVVHNGEATLQAGAGIVHDSDPAREHLECRGKMQVLLDAIRLAEAGLR